MRVLAIGAHADDIELGMGGTICKHVSSGDYVCMLIITHSEYNFHNGKVMRTRSVAQKEAKNAAQILGVSNLKCLNYKTKFVSYGPSLIEDIDRIIDQLSIDTVYTHWDGDVHQDHSAISKATVTAARNIPRVLMYRSNWYDSAIQFDGNFYVDISEHIDKKINSIKAHETEFNKYGKKWIEFHKSQTRIKGIQLGVDYAESFKVVKWMI